MNPKREKFYWICAGDINAFFGLMLDNISNLVILSALLIGIFKMPPELVLYKMIPGSALGVLAGDLIYTWMAIRLGNKLNRNDVTAMPLGLDTPSLFGVALGIIGPTFKDTGNALLAWKVGMASVVIMGIVKIIASFFGEKIREAVPRAGLLGSIAGIAILLIAFLPLLKIFEHPVSGLISFSVVFLTLIARVKLPYGFPGAFAGVIAGTALYYIFLLLTEGKINIENTSPFFFSFPVPTLEFLGGMKIALKYISLSIPFAIATVIGGIDVTESAGVEGDLYDTREILLAEGIATFLAGLCGGVIQSTPYIGHPAYKKMGGRAGYTLFTALFIGIGGMVGFLPYVITFIPESAISPILVFIGLEITSQAYRATPSEHYPALSLALLPSAAYLLLIQLKNFLSPLDLSSLPPHLQSTYQTIIILGNGFILTALLWGGAFAHLTSGERKKAFFYTLVLALFTLFGIVHSPLPDGALFFPWKIKSKVTYILSFSYILCGLFFFTGKFKKFTGNQ